MLKKQVLLAAAAFLACAGAALAAVPDYLSAAIADKDRPDSDARRDEYYKPAEVIAFAGIRPGMKVADFMAGDGYYSRLFSRIVGPRGYVYAYYTTQQDTAAIRQGAAAGAALSPYHNIGIVHGPVEAFVTPEKVDLVWTGLTYHDLHGPNFKGMDIAPINKAMFDTLKPGGILMVLDRASRRGAGLGDLEKTARIDEEAVKQEVEAAGFKFAGESDVLHNPADDYSKRITKAQYQMRPDEFLLKFRKPR